MTETQLLTYNFRTDINEILERIGNKKMEVELFPISQIDTFNNIIGVITLGEYSISLITSFDEAIQKFVLGIKDQYFTAEDYTRFISSSSLTYKSKIITYNDILASGIKFMPEREHFAFPEKDFSKSIKIKSEIYRYNTFEDINLNDFLYLHSYKQCPINHQYIIYGVKKSTWNLKYDPEFNNNTPEHDDYDGTGLKNPFGKGE